MTRVPYDGDEKGSLHASLDRHRDAVVWKLEGLGDEALRRPVTPSGTSLLGLVKHLAGGEYGWFCDTFGRSREALPFDLKEDPEADMRAAPGESTADILALYARARAAADQVIAELDLSATGTAWFGATVTLRWVLIHVLEDTARHAGHADIARELIDGSTGDHRRSDPGEALPDWPGTGHGTEHALAGGNVAAAVVRAGDTVRKPAGFWTPAVTELLAFLEARGFSGAPRALGRDDQGRQVLEYVPGPMAIDQPPLDAAGLHRVGRLIRDLHDVSADFPPPRGARWNVAIPPDRADFVCHHDLAPWNLVLGADQWVFIDWDGAGPGSRLWDLAYAVKGFVPLEDGGDPAFDGLRLRAMADGYGLSAGQRSRLPALIGAHTRGMADLLENGARTGTQPWARLHAEGHGTYWAACADYIDRHLATWRQFLR